MPHGPSELKNLPRPRPTPLWRRPPPPLLGRGPGGLGPDTRFRILPKHFFLLRLPPRAPWPLAIQHFQPTLVRRPQWSAPGQSGCHQQPTSGPPKVAQHILNVRPASSAACQLLVVRAAWPRRHLCHQHSACRAMAVIGTATVSRPAFFNIWGCQMWPATKLTRVHCWIMRSPPRQLVVCARPCRSSARSRPGTVHPPHKICRTAGSRRLRLDQPARTPFTSGWRISHSTWRRAGLPATPQRRKGHYAPLGCPGFCRRPSPPHPTPHLALALLAAQSGPARTPASSMLPTPGPLPAAMLGPGRALDAGPPPPANRRAVWPGPQK